MLTFTGVLGGVVGFGVMEGCGGGWGGKESMFGCGRDVNLSH